MARFGSIPSEGNRFEFLYEQRQRRSACESAVQQLVEGVVGFGGVTADLHAISPETETLHMVWALEIWSTPLLEIATSSTATTTKSLILNASMKTKQLACKR